MSNGPSSDSVFSCVAARSAPVLRVSVSLIDTDVLRTFPELMVSQSQLWLWV